MRDNDYSSASVETALNHPNNYPKPVQWEDY